VLCVHVLLKHTLGGHTSVWEVTETMMMHGPLEVEAYKHGGSIIPWLRVHLLLTGQAGAV
jgi:hypothetical protein